MTYLDDLDLDDDDIDDDPYEHLGPAERAAEEYADDVDFRLTLRSLGHAA